MPDPKSPLLTLRGAVFDKKTCKIQVSAYLGLSKHFADDCTSKHPNKDYPGLRDGEEVPDGVRPWDDAWKGKATPNQKGRHCGWIAQVPESKPPQSVWFNARVTGSFRLAFLLARLQRQIWEDQKEKGKNINLGKLFKCKLKASGKSKCLSKASKVSVAKSASSKGSKVKLEQSSGSKRRDKGFRSASKKFAERQLKQSAGKSHVPPDPRTPKLTVKGAVYDKKGGRLQTASYQDLRKYFVDEWKTRHPYKEFPGVRVGEEVPAGLIMWDDAKKAKDLRVPIKGQSRGWIARVPEGDGRCVWFNTRATGSFRLSFLLARLQRNIWEERMEAGRSNEKPTVKAEQSVAAKPMKAKGFRAAATKFAKQRGKRGKRLKPGTGMKSTKDVPRGALLTYTGESPSKSGKSSYIDRRCKRLHGLTLGAALDTYKFTDKDGSRRSYTFMDFRYDLACGRLHVNGDSKTAGAKFNALDKQTKARAALGMPAVKVEGGQAAQNAQTDAPATPKRPKAKTGVMRSPVSSAKAKVMVTKVAKGFRAKSPGSNWAETLADGRARTIAAAAEAAAAAEDEAKNETMEAAVAAAAAAGKALEAAAALVIGAPPSAKRRLPRWSSAVLAPPAQRRLPQIKRPRLDGAEDAESKKQAAVEAPKRRLSQMKWRRLSTPASDKSRPVIAATSDPRADEGAEFLGAAGLEKVQPDLAQAALEEEAAPAKETEHEEDEDMEAEEEEEEEEEEEDDEEDPEDTRPTSADDEFEALVAMPHN